MKQIEAGNESYTLYIDFRDEYNEFDTPISVSYKMYSVTTETIIVTTTSLTPDKEIELPLTGNLVALQVATNLKELNRICVTAVSSDSRTITNCIEYEVIPNSECYCG